MHGGTSQCFRSSRYRTDVIANISGNSLRPRVLALMDTYRVSGPCLGLFELIEQINDGGPQLRVGLFLRDPRTSSPACEEAARRDIPFVVVREKYRYDPRPILQAMQIVKKYNISILQSHSYKAAVVAWILKRLTGLPWIAFVHGYTAENRRMAMYNRLEHWLLRGADRVVAVSDATKVVLQRTGLPEHRVRVIHNGINPERCSTETHGDRLRYLWEADPQKLLIGVIGRFSPEKGHALFLNAFKIVVKALPDSRAVLIGEGQEKEVLEAMVKTAGLESHVHLAGYQKDMSSVYKALDLIVIPSFTEGLPNVLLEALLHGKAVVGTAVGGIPEVMQGILSQCLVPPGDAQALAEKILEILKDSSLRNELSEAGKKVVEERFSLSQRVQKLTGLYREVIGLRDSVCPIR